MKTLRLHHALALAGTLASLTSATARADVETTGMDASKCIAQQSVDVPKLKANKTAKTIKNDSATETLTVYCPIKKVASGPGISNDYIKRVTLDLTFDLPGTASCEVWTWRTGVDSGVDNNRLSPTFGNSLTRTTATATKQPLTLTGGAATTARYWDGTSATYGRASWYFSMVRCRLPPKATIHPYKVLESGADTGYTIEPMSTCALDSDMSWRVNEDDTSRPGPTGQVQAQASGTAEKFRYTCPTTNNRIYQLAFGHASGPNISGCSLNNPNMAAPQWLAFNGPEWPTEVLPVAYAPTMLIPMNGAFTLYCGQYGPQGDSKWMSIRTAPNRSRAGRWTVKASNNTNGVDGALDSSGGTRWATNTRGLAGMWYQIDFGTNIPVISNVILDSGTWTNDWARKFTVMFSSDAVNWFELPQTATGPVTSVTFSEQAYRYMRIRLDQDMPGTNYWSIAELNVMRNNAY